MIELVPRPPTGATMPPLGLVLGADAEAEAPQRLRALRPAFLRADVAPSAAVDARLDAGARAAAASGAELEVALLVEDAAAAAALATAAARVRPARVLVFPRHAETTDAAVAEAAASALARAGCAATLGGGTDRFFAELNRARPPVAALDVVCYSISPQVHASDDLSVMETLEVQGATVATARTFAGGRPIHVGPVTLRMRYNPDALASEDEEAAIAAERLPSSVDPRQASLFAAAFTLGSIMELAAAGAAAVTLCETTGWRGLMARAGGSPPPFRGGASGVFPAYHVVADASELRGAALRTVETAPGPVRAVALDAPGGTVLLAANCGPDPVTAGVACRRARVRVLDLDAVRLACAEPEAFRGAPTSVRTSSSSSVRLELGPYATARIDLQE